MYVPPFLPSPTIVRTSTVPLRHGKPFPAGSCMMTVRPSSEITSPVMPSRRISYGMLLTLNCSDSFCWSSRSANGSASHGISL